MKRVILGQSGLEVTEFCLGTMTWGSAQNDEADAHAQLDRALDRGINFLDTAEMYPVNPVRAETVGRTEAYIGSWVAKSGRRDDYVIATKMAGLNERFVRQGEPVTGATLRQALEASLRRLNTDWIDLYQLHWPNRGSFQFRQNWTYDPSAQDAAAERAAMAEIMETLTILSLLRAPVKAWPARSARGVDWQIRGRSRLARLFTPIRAAFPRLTGLLR